MPNVSISMRTKAEHAGGPVKPPAGATNALKGGIELSRLQPNNRWRGGRPRPTHRKSPTMRKIISIAAMLASTSAFAETSNEHIIKSIVDKAAFEAQVPRCDIANLTS
jgi:hypothetical protein